MDERLRADLEAKAILRKVQANGDFATILRRGDAERGALLLLVCSRGLLHGLIERAIGSDFRYTWSIDRFGGPVESAAMDRIIAEKSRFDTDSWILELDVADPERFIAETISGG